VRCGEKLYVDGRLRCVSVVIYRAEVEDWDQVSEEQCHPISMKFQSHAVIRAQEAGTRRSIYTLFIDMVWTRGKQL